MENKRFTKIILEQSNIKLTWEVPFEDVTTQDMMQALRSIMVGMSFSEKQVYSGMVNFINEYASDKYVITEKIDDEYDILNYDENNTNEIVDVIDKPHYYA